MASRLEGLTRVYGVDILVSDAVYTAMKKKDFIFRYIDTVCVLGKKEPVVLYQLLGVCSSIGITDEKILEEEEYHSALHLYRSGSFQDAAAAFQGLCKKYQEESVYVLYAERCLGLADEPPKNWNGVVEMQEK
ncbi:MAG: hypothetical protein D3916_17910 [Candidatus Electrothrix sp. MAN1_4]|nr:hypothetical protein [Candidatus Electrothrix sp. MAN1_4]